MPGLSTDDTDRRAQAGFTLLEILVVIAILGLLVGLVAPAALRQLGGARVNVAKQSIERLAGTLDLFKLDVGRYPTSDEGLRALNERPANLATWSGPYVKGDAVPKDPWNQDYLNRIPSSRPNHDFDLCSHGPNNSQSEQDLICNK